MSSLYLIWDQVISAVLGTPSELWWVDALCDKSNQYVLYVDMAAVVIFNRFIWRRHNFWWVMSRVLGSQPDTEAGQGCFWSECASGVVLRRLPDTTIKEFSKSWVADEQEVRLVHGLYWDGPWVDKYWWKSIKRSEYKKKWGIKDKPMNKKTSMMLTYIGLPIEHVVYSRLPIEQVVYSRLPIEHVVYSRLHIYNIMLCSVC